MNWSKGAKTIAIFQTLRRGCNHSLHIATDSIDKISQLYDDVKNDSEWKQDVEDALEGTDVTLQDIRNDVNSYKSTRDTIITNHGYIFPPQVIRPVGFSSNINFGSHSIQQ